MFCLLVAVLMAQVAPSANAVITSPVANMYSRANVNADVVSQSIYGTNVRVVSRSGAWVRVRTADAYMGWMAASAVSRRPAYAQAAGSVQVESLFANVYREADVTRHRPLLTIPFEARLEVLPVREEDPRWLAVRLVSGRKAWVQRGDVTADLRPRALAEAIEFSRRFLGLPYLWGGTSTYGYDCSGFMQMLCRRRGFVIPRDASKQAAWEGMSTVARDQLRPGDLLYFGAGAEKITHTGMYLGHGEFIDATPWQQPVVRIDRLDDPHWAPLLVAARRIQ